MRKWFKLYGHDLLYGSTLKELNYKEFSIWIELLCLACDSPIDGLVMAREGEGYKPIEIALKIKAPLSVVKSALEKLQLPSGKDNIPKIIILDNNIIKINKWHIYQSDYSRQKPYRQQQQEPDNWKRNYAIGMEAEREHNSKKEKRTDIINPKIKELANKIIKEVK
jgi:hypothetical protein